MPFIITYGRYASGLRVTFRGRTKLQQTRDTIILLLLVFFFSLLVNGYNTPEHWENHKHETNKLLFSSYIQSYKLESRKTGCLAYFINTQGGFYAHPCYPPPQWVRLVACGWTGIRFLISKSWSSIILLFSFHWICIVYCALLN